MADVEQDNPKITVEATLGEATQRAVGSKLIQRLDAFLNRLYQNRWEAEPPQDINGQVWAMPSTPLPFPWASDTPGKNIQPGDSYFLHYFQSQGYGPTPNECVTTSALMSMNMLKDWLALRHGARVEPNQSLEEYTNELESLGLRGWIYRFPAKSPLPGMMTPWQAVITLKAFAKRLMEIYGKAYRVKLSTHHNTTDLIERLQNGDLILLHGAWRMTLDRHNKDFGYNAVLAFLGGMPHTMLLIGYDAIASQWLLLNPADPWPADKHKTVTPKLYKMNTRQLMEFWGRKFLFYPPRFAITTIMLEA